MAMGMVAFVTVFTTAFVGMSVVWDRRLGFLNKVLSTPVSRSSIIISKVLSASIRSIFQAAIVTVIAFLLGLQLGANFTVFSVFGVFAIVFLIRLRVILAVHSHLFTSDKNGDAAGNLQPCDASADVCKQRILPNHSDAKLVTGNSKR